MSICMPATAQAHTHHACIVRCEASVLGNLLIMLDNVLALMYVSGPSRRTSRTCTFTACVCK